MQSNEQIKLNTWHIKHDWCNLNEIYAELSGQECLPNLRYYEYVCQQDHLNCGGWQSNRVTLVITEAR